jgi:hypothetical protein
VNTVNAVVQGTLQPDGLTLRLDEKLPLPPGRVQVIIQQCPPQGRATMLEVLDRIHREQRERGHKGMSEEEMASEIAALRAEDDEAEKRWQQIWSETHSPLPGEGQR